MRGDQLSVIARTALPDRPVKYTELGTPLRRSDVILTKGALKAMTMPILEQLRAGDNRLFFDVVDEVPPPYTALFCDVLLAASITASIELMRDFADLPVVLVNHHVDPRIAAVAPHPPTGRLEAAYFGETVNAILDGAIAERVRVVGIDTSRVDDSWIDHLGEANLHYAVRATRDLDHHKPFLKGFTAAACGANVLIQADQTEAVHWLGPDYPFLLRQGHDVPAVLEALDHAAEAFGGPEWQQGLDVMADIRARTSIARIGAELRRALAG